MRLDVWCPVPDLRVGDRVITHDNRSSRKIVRFDSAFNPAFRPTVFADDPHTACDLARDGDVKIACRASWAIDTAGTVTAITPVSLLPEQDSKRRSRQAFLACA